MSCLLLSKAVSDLIVQKRKWELTQEALDKLLQWLDADSTLAAKKYEEIRLALIKFFEYRRCLEPEDYTDETIDRVARRINEGVEVLTDNPFLYFYGVALRVLQEYQRKQARPSLPMPEPDDATAREIRFECMDRCLEALPAETRAMLARYCRGEKRNRTEDRSKMAEDAGISLNTLRIRVHRLREQLERCVSQCVRQSEK